MAGEKPELPRPFTRWRHAKTGREYVVLSLARLEATLEPVVVYRPLGCVTGDVWVRPVAEFLDGRFAEVSA